MRARVHRSRVTHERWLVSYADFITLLFGLFVVMFAFARSSSHQQKQMAQAVQAGFDSMGVTAQNSQNAQSTQTQAVNGEQAVAQVKAAPKEVSAQRVQDDLQHLRKEMGKELAKELDAHVIALRMDRDGLVISLREGGFFASGSSVPNPQAYEVLRKVAGVLGDTPYNLRVEGHTDNLPVHSSTFASNWELSAARAASIARMLLQLDAIAPARLTVAGYGEFHPVATNATPEGRAQNRRVDLLVLPQVDLDFSIPENTHPKSEWLKITDGESH